MISCRLGLLEEVAARPGTQGGRDGRVVGHHREDQDGEIRLFRFARRRTRA
jgi:hypothetical protein